MNVYLMGYRGTGKTSVGRLLAERLGWTWLDTDQLVQESSGLAIADIFQQRGESAFRDLESQAVRQVAALIRQVVSLGGGAVLRPANRQLIRTSGKTVWLTADPATIAQRLAADENTAANRPSLTGQTAVDEIRQVLTQREAVYTEMADWQVDTVRRTPPEIAADIADWLNSQPPG